MSLIDRAIQDLDAPASPPPIMLSLPEAFAAVLVAAISTDGSFGVEEAVRLNSVLSTSRLLDQAIQERDVNVVERALNLLTERGVGPVLGACRAAIPPDLRATVFAVATDLILADGRIDGREKAFVDQLRSALDVDDATALQIVEVMLVKNRG
jgi:hypothetical protein